MDPRYRLLLSAAASTILVVGSLLHANAWIQLPSVAWVLGAAALAVVLLLVHHFSYQMDAALWGRRLERLALWGVMASWMPLALRQFALYYLPFRYRWTLLPQDEWPDSIQWALFWAEHSMAQHFLGAALIVGLLFLLLPATRRWGAALALLAALPAGLTAWFFDAGPSWLWALPMLPVLVWSFDTRQIQDRPNWPRWVWILLPLWTFSAAWPSFQEPNAEVVGRFGVVDFYNPGHGRPETLVWDVDSKLLLQYPNGSTRMADVQWSSSNPNEFEATWRLPAQEQGQTLRGTWQLDSLDQAYELRGTWNGQPFALRAVREY